MCPEDTGRQGVASHQELGGIRKVLTRVLEGEQPCDPSTSHFQPIEPEQYISVVESHPGVAASGDLCRVMSTPCRPDMSTPVAGSQLHTGRKYTPESGAQRPPNSSLKPRGWDF